MGNPGAVAIGRTPTHAMTRGHCVAAACRGRPVLDDSRARGLIDRPRAPEVSGDSRAGRGRRCCRPRAAEPAFDSVACRQVDVRQEAIYAVRVGVRQRLPSNSRSSVLAYGVAPKVSRSLGIGIAKAGASGVVGSGAARPRWSPHRDYNAPASDLAQPPSSHRPLAGEGAAVAATKTTRDELTASRDVAALASDGRTTPSIADTRPPSGSTRRERRCAAGAHRWPPEKTAPVWARFEYRTARNGPSSQGTRVRARGPVFAADLQMDRSRS